MADAKILNVYDSCKTIPMRIEGFDTQGFLAWLIRQGAEIGIPSNPYEALRYRAMSPDGKSQVHVVYRKDSGLLTWTGETMRHYTRFLKDAAQPLPDTEPAEGIFLRTYPTEEAKRSLRIETREKLLRRDGDSCWFCGKPMGADATIEHLVPKARGGRNMLANYALAHRKCNNRAGDMPLIEKIELRNRMRGK